LVALNAAVFQGKENTVSQAPEAKEFLAKIAGADILQRKSSIRMNKKCWP